MLVEMNNKADNYKYEVFMTEKDESQSQPRLSDEGQRLVGELMTHGFMHQEPTDKIRIDTLNNFASSEHRIPDESLREIIEDLRAVGELE